MTLVLMVIGWISYTHKTNTTVKREIISSYADIHWTFNTEYALNIDHNLSQHVLLVYFCYPKEMYLMDIKVVSLIVTFKFSDIGFAQIYYKHGFVFQTSIYLLVTQIGIWRNIWKLFLSYWATIENCCKIYRKKNQNTCVVIFELVYLFVTFDLQSSYLKH